MRYSVCCSFMCGGGGFNSSNGEQSTLWEWNRLSFEDDGSVRIKGNTSMRMIMLYIQQILPPSWEVKPNKGPERNNQESRRRLLNQSNKHPPLPLKGTGWREYQGLTTSARDEYETKTNGRIRNERLWIQWAAPASSESENREDIARADRVVIQRCSSSIHSSSSTGRVLPALVHRTISGLCGWLFACSPVKGTRRSTAGH